MYENLFIRHRYHVSLMVLYPKKIVSKFQKSRCLNPRTSESGMESVPRPPSSNCRNTVHASMRLKDVGRDELQC